ncbi:MAG: BON domain-containing protein [Ginsengibacter sp.]
MDNNRNRDYRNPSDIHNRDKNDDWRNGNSTRNNRNYDSSHTGWNDNYGENRNSPNYRSDMQDHERNYGLGDTSQGSANYGHQDYSDGSRYYGTGNLGGHYGGNDRHSRARTDRNRDNNNSNGDRDWWDRTSDEVASWFGDEDAERRRNRDKKEGPHRGKGPKGYVRSDEKITDDINDKLYHDSYVDASDIEVSVIGGEVILSGTVYDKDTKRRAEDLAENITGVHDVTNNIKVNRTATTNRSANLDDNASTLI